MKYISSISIIVSISIFSGCAVKDKDSLAMKTAKHTVNSPMYLLLGIGLAATKLTEIAIMTPVVAVGKAIEGDSEEIKKLKKLSNEGDAESQAQLGYSYQYGKGLSKNLEKARFWYEKASLNDGLLGTHNLGILYYNGYGVDLNKQKAYELLSKSANSNFNISQNTLGYIHAKDKDFKNYELSLNWYEKAIKNGNINAKCNIVYPLLETDNSLETRQKAKKYVSQAKLQTNYSYCTTVWNHYKLDSI